MEPPRIIYREESLSSDSDEDKDSQRPDKYHCLVCKDMYMDFEEINDHIRRYHFKELMKAVSENQGNVTSAKSFPNAEALTKPHQTSGPSSFKTLLGPEDCKTNQAKELAKKSQKASGLGGLKMLQLSNLITTDILKIYEKEEEEFRARIPEVGYGAHSFLMPYTPNRENEDPSYDFPSTDFKQDNQGDVSSIREVDTFACTPSPVSTPVLDLDPMVSRDGWMDTPTHDGAFSPMLSPGVSCPSQFDGPSPQPKWRSMSPRQKRFTFSGASPGSIDLGRDYLKRKYDQLLSPVNPFHGSPGYSPNLPKNQEMIERKDKLIESKYQELGLSPCFTDVSQNTVDKGYSPAENQERSSTLPLQAKSDICYLFRPPRFFEFPGKAKDILTKAFGNPRNLKVDPYFKYLWEITMEKKGLQTWDPNNVGDFAQTHGWAGEYVRFTDKYGFIPEDYPFLHYLCRRGNLSQGPKYDRGTLR